MKERERETTRSLPAPSPALAEEGRGGDVCVAFARRLRQLSTDAEKRLWSTLRNHELGWHFRRQHPVRPYILDFACVDLRVGIEADGGQHAETDADRIRDAHLAEHGWLMLRFWNNDVLQNTDGILEVIMDECRRRAPHPNPPPQERERGKGTLQERETKRLQHAPSPASAGEGRGGGCFRRDSAYVASEERA